MRVDYTEVHISSGHVKTATEQEGGFYNYYENSVWKKLAWIRADGYLKR